MDDNPKYKKQSLNIIDGISYIFRCMANVMIAPWEQPRYSYKKTDTVRQAWKSVGEHLDNAMERIDTQSNSKNKMKHRMDRKAPERFWF